MAITDNTSHVVVRLPRPLRAELERLAGLYDRSLSSEVRRALTLHVLAQGLKATTAREATDARTEALDRH